MERADVLFALADVLSWVLQVDSATIVGLCDEAFAEAAQDDARIARILAHRSAVHVLAGDLGAGSRRWTSGARGGRASRRPAPCSRSRSRDWERPRRTRRILLPASSSEAWRSSGDSVVLEYPESARVALGRRMMRLDEVEQARVLFAELEAEAAARGAEVTRTGILWILSMLDSRLAGRWPRAIEYAVAARELTELIGASTLYGQAGRVGALLEGDLSPPSWRELRPRRQSTSHR